MEKGLRKEINAEFLKVSIECYIGAPIVVDGKPWGCIDFSSMVQRGSAFDEQDLDRIKSLATELSELIASGG